MFKLKCFVIIVIALTSLLLISSLLGNNAALAGKLINNRWFNQHPIVKPVPVPTHLYGSRYNPKTTTRTMESIERRKPSKLFKNFRYLENIWQDCGELCNTSRDGISGPYFNLVNTTIQCKKLFKNEDFDRGHGEAHAPKEIPKELLQEFTMNGRLKIQKWYFDRKYLGGKARSPIWSKDDVERQIDLARKGKLPGAYNTPETNALRDGLKHAPHVKNGRILVIGSESPWVEASVLEAGAREVVTLEYGTIISKHAKIKTMVPSQFRQKYLNGTLGLFDGIVTFFSVEHSGLGRYGDALNPWGDIITVARAWCVTRMGGSLTIGVPYSSGKDILVFNAHRVYGNIRYLYLTTNWHQFYEGHGSQRVYVFTK